MDSDGTNAWMGTRTLVRVGRGKRSVLRDLAELEQHGWVKVRRRGSRFRTNVYEARIPADLTGVVPLEVVPLDNESSTSVVTFPPPEVPDSTVSGDNSDPERSQDLAIRDVGEFCGCTSPRDEHKDGYCDYCGGLITIVDAKEEDAA
jgi:hypothetical protein